MFLEFSVANFRSFKDRATLSMEATTDDWLEETHVANVGGRRLARTVAVYGANAGGKSNLLLAMSTFREFLKNSSKNTQLGDRIPVIPFRLHTETERAPSHFEVVFVIDGTRYRYGFEATTEAVTAEWLFSQADSIRETTLFTREDNRIEVSDAFREGRSFEKFTRQNALFLSVVAQFNGETAGKIMGWMLRFNGISGISDQATLEFTVNLMSNSEYAPLILNLIRQADVGIESLKRMEVSPDQVVATLPKGIPDGIRELFLQSASREHTPSEPSTAGSTLPVMLATPWSSTSKQRNQQEPRNWSRWPDPSFTPCARVLFFLSTSLRHGCTHCSPRHWWVFSTALPTPRMPN